MPGTADANSLISDKLTSILRTPLSLDQRLVSSAKKILLERIEFEPAKKTSAAFVNDLRAKYTPLNAAMNSNGEVKQVKPAAAKANLGSSTLADDSKLCLDWRINRPIGVGLVNLGNTCFLNSVLQCLVYTPALINYLTSQHQPNQCKVNGLCMLCEMYSLIKLCLMGSSGPVKPLPILRNLKAVAKHMKWGRQEDAHEFLRHIVEAMRCAEVKKFPKPDSRLRPATGICKIFGGFLRSQVVCLECRYKSCTYDPFLDISLDIRNATNVENGLQKFVTPELLSKDNAYKCSKCCRKVSAKKSFSIHVAPNVLTIQFKRYSGQGGKISRHIGFSQVLDIRPYMSERGGEPVRYLLYAVLLHDGYSTNSGHYYCYVAAPNKKWHCMNDSSVYSASISHVLQSQAYLLFYRREATTSTSQAAAATANAAATATAGVSPASRLTAAGNPSPFKSGLTTSAASKPTTNGFSSTFKPTLITASASKPTVSPFKPSVIAASTSKPPTAGFTSTFKPTMISAGPLKSAVKVTATATSATTIQSSEKKKDGSKSHNGTNGSVTAPADLCAKTEGVKTVLTSPLSNGIDIKKDGKIAEKKELSKNGLSDSLKAKQSEAGDEAAVGEMEKKRRKKKKKLMKMLNESSVSSTSDVEEKKSRKLLTKKQKKLLKQFLGDEFEAYNSLTKKKKKKFLKFLFSEGLNFRTKKQKKKKNATTNGNDSTLDDDNKSHAVVNGLHPAQEVKQDTSEDQKTRKRKRKKRKQVENGEAESPEDGLSAGMSPGSSGTERLTTATTNGSQNGHTKIAKAQTDDVQKWDQILPAGYHCVGIKNRHPEAKLKQSQSWNGTADSKSPIVRQLEQFSHGYGVEVTTWDGGRPVLDSESAKERRLALKRSRSDSYNEEIDCGKVQKLKKFRRLSDVAGAASSENLFQKLANSRY